MVSQPAERAGARRNVHAGLDAPALRREARASTPIRQIGCGTPRAGGIAATVAGWREAGKSPAPDHRRRPLSGALEAEIGAPTPTATAKRQLDVIMDRRHGARARPRPPITPRGRGCDPDFDPAALWRWRSIRSTARRTSTSTCLSPRSFRSFPPRGMDASGVVHPAGLGAGRGRLCRLWSADGLLLTLGEGVRIFVARPRTRRGIHAIAEHVRSRRRRANTRSTLE